MATKFIIAPTAHADLIEILDFIAADNPSRALSFIDEIEVSTRKLLTEFPDSGTPYKNNMRYHVVSGYVVVYEHNFDADTIAILSVHRPGKDWKNN